MQARRFICELASGLFSQPEASAGIARPFDVQGGCSRIEELFIVEVLKPGELPREAL